MPRIHLRNSMRVMRRCAIGFILAGLLVAAGWVSLDHAPAVRAASSVTINGATTYQVIDGFGASDAFRVGSLIRGTSGSSLTAAQTQQIMNDLFSTTSGAGLSIVRNEVGASTTGSSGDNQPSIEPNAPSGPNATPTYVWNTGDPSLDGDQVWFSQTAKGYGVNQFYADAWSAPQFMKTNGALSDGGFLCGETGSGAPTCASGDWRQAYANYLTQYAKFYHQAGVDLNDIGYGNETDFTPSYVGMNFDATTAAGNRGTLDAAMPQDIDFIKNYLGPTLKAAGLTTKVACCDATSWDHANTYASGILADASASNYLGLVTGHGYYSSPNGVITTPIATKGQHVWETETSTFDNFNPAWDDGSDASGFQWGLNLWNALTNASANGFLYWWFAANNSSNSDNEGLININGGTFTIAKRLDAFANYSRFIRPGATRIGASSGDSNLHLTAAKNADGSYTIVALNAASSDTATSFALQNITGASAATPYLTNASNDMAQQAAIPISGGSFTATIPARSLVTYRVTATTPPTLTPPPSATPTQVPPTPTYILPTPTPATIAACKITYTVQNQWPGGFTANVTVANTGTTTINGWKLAFTFPATGQAAGQGWSATWAQSGQNVTATNLSWNSTLAPGASTPIGFNGTWTTSNPLPASFTLNGVACAKG